jgi:hypothetical protein
MEDYTLLEMGWKKVKETDSAVRSISVAPDGTTYAVKADGKIYHIEHVNALQGEGQGPGWTLIQVPLSGVRYITIGYNGAMQLTNESDLKKIKDINDSLQEQIQTTIRERMDELYADKTGLYPNKEETIKRLNATFEQLQRDREQIDMLLKDYYSYDESQESAALYAESSNMRFRVLFVVFFVIVIFTIRSMMRKANPFMELANPLSERMLYLGIVVALLFALNLFQNTFGFILFAGLLLLAVLLVSGPGNSFVPGSIAPSYMTPSSMVPSYMMGPATMPLLSPIRSPMQSPMIGSPFSR